MNYDIIIRIGYSNTVGIKGVNSELQKRLRNESFP